MYTKRQFPDSCLGAKRHAGYVMAAPIWSIMQLCYKNQRHQLMITFIT